MIPIVVHDPEWDEFASIEVANHAAWWHVMRRLEEEWDCPRGYRLVTADGEPIQDAPAPRKLPTPIRLTYLPPA